MAKEEKPQPKIPFHEVHEVLATVLKDYKFMVLAIEKEDLGKEDGQMFINTNFGRKELVKELKGVISQVEGNQTIDTYVKPRDIGL